jgi:GT2 family glycosyltransferase
MNTQKSIKTKTEQLDLEIIILSFNTQFWLKKTLQTLQEFYLEKTKYTVQVTIVDNNSTDESVAMVQELFPKVNLIQSPSNDGFAAGNNLALKKTTAKYAMLLNSDMEFTEKSNLDTLIEYLDNKTEVGVVSPAVMLPTGNLDPASHRGEPTLWASITYFLGLEKLFPTSKLFGQYHQWYKPLNIIHTIDACSGAAMIVRTSLLKKVGLLDEQFFMYAEDLDWCKRFRDSEYLIVFHPEVVVIHHKYKSGLGSGSKKIARKTSVHFYDTMLQYYDKHYAKQYPSVVRSILQVLIQIRKGVL